MTTFAKESYNRTAGGGKCYSNGWVTVYIKGRKGFQKTVFAEAGKDLTFGEF